MTSRDGDSTFRKKITIEHLVLSSKCPCILRICFIIVVFPESPVPSSSTRCVICSTSDSDFKFLSIVLCAFSSVGSTMIDPIVFGFCPYCTQTTRSDIKLSMYLMYSAPHSKQQTVITNTNAAISHDFACGFLLVSRMVWTEERKLVDLLRWCVVFCFF